MNYQSTRNAGLTESSAGAVLKGIAPDGGLYTMPSLSQCHWGWFCLTLVDKVVRKNRPR